MIKLYNSQTRRKEDFKPVEEGHVRMYVCGPTVYNYIHIGNARTFISFDTIRRYLMWRGLKVTFVQNVTDVDDKIIKKANEEGRSAAEVAKEYTEAFIADMHATGVMDPDVRPKATEEIPAMIELARPSSTAAMPMWRKATCTSTCAPSRATASCPAATSTRWKAVIATWSRAERWTTASATRWTSRREAGRAELGFPLGTGPSGLAYRVLGDVEEVPRPAA